MTKIILALDGLKLGRCLELIALAERFSQWIGAIKIHDLWDSEGPGVVATLKRANAPAVMVDIKLHDIAKTVKKRAEAVARSGGDFLTVHIAGGADMLYGALDGAANSGLKIWGITELTSLGEEETHLNTGNPAKAVVLYRARIAKLVGLDAIVCSPQELAMLHKRRELKGLKCITPGVRSVGVAINDQVRIDTPVNAAANGAFCIVVGSEFTESPNPSDALANIVQQLEDAHAKLAGLEV